MNYRYGVTLEEVLQLVAEEETQKHHIGDIPIMVRSDKCDTSRVTEDQVIDVGDDPYDPGGYFIINGSVRIIVGLEDLSPNKIIVEKDKVLSLIHI